MSDTAERLSGTFVADPTHSTFQFSVKHMGIGIFRGTFDSVDVTTTLGESIGRLHGSARVESISIKNPIAFREHIVNGADFFDARNHPEITFSSSDVRLGDGASLSMSGNLTIKGVTKPFRAAGSHSAVIQDLVGQTRTAVQLTATIDRRDWGLTWQAQLSNGGDALGNRVDLSAYVELIRQP
ncbi:YceI family protein [Fodinicola feengrottensis]